MAKTGVDPGVDLKGIRAAIEEVEAQVSKLRTQSKSSTEKSEMTALRRALKDVKSMVAAECPPGMFRSFSVGGQAARQPKAARAARASKKKKK